MKNFSFLFALLSLCLVLEGRSEGFNDFSGGLNTNASWSLIKPNQAFRCENFLLDDPVGALTVRNGYHAISDSLADHKRIYSLNAYRFPSGGSFLFQVVQRDTATNDCDLYVSDAYGFGLSDKLYDWIYPARGMWVNWLERQYYFNGRQEPIVVNGGSEDFYAQELTLPAPGQLVVQPLSEAGNPDGEYVWAYLTHVPCDTLRWSKRCGVLSKPIRCNNEKARITNFQGHIRDSLCSPYDSINIIILRTRAGKTSNTDTLWRLAVLWVNMADISSFVWIDNKADADLYIPWRTIADTVLYDGNPLAWWSNTNNEVQWDYGAYKNRAYAPGSPMFTYSDSGIVPEDTVNVAINASDRAAGYAVTFQCYHVYYLDTLTGSISDTSRGLWWRFSPSQIIRTRTIALPPTPTSRWARVILRSDYDKYSPFSGGHPHPGLETRYVLDTIMDSAQTEYLDHMEPPDLLMSGAYERRLTDGLLKGAIVHEARMFAWDDFRVWPSAYDTAAVFRLTDNIEFDLDDGDVIVACASFEGYIVVYKTRSIWILYTDDGIVYDRVKASKGYGAVSAATLDYYSGANLVLGPDGVLVSIDNQYRSNATSRNYISQAIKNILLRPVDDMLDAAGKVLGHRYFLSYPGTDSTFVYFFNASSWGLFTGFDFWQGIIYDTVSTWDFQTFDDFWFIKDDDERLFIWDESDTTDNGTAFTATWEKQYLERSPAIKQVLTDAYLATEASVLVADSLTLTITDENAESIGSFKVQLSEMYHRVPVLAENNRVFHHLNVSMEVPNRSNLKITGLDLQVKQAGERE